jgi:uncharacterized membrane protein YjgN (DUF898 family)
MHPPRVVFAGNAEELRRHSRRDLAINIVLGGLYTSVARRHRAQYLASRTLIDGTPITQLPPAKSRWPAILLVAAFIALRLANEFGHGPPLPWLVVCGVLLIPYLWGSVARWTIAALRWRSLPLAFSARWTEIYAASWPLFVLGLAWAALEPTVSAVAANGEVDGRIVAGALAAAVLAFPLLAALAFNWRRLRFTRTRVGSLELAWSASFGSYLRICGVTALAVLATAIAPVLLVRMAVFGSPGVPDLQDEGTAAVYLGSLLAIFVLSTPARAWYEASVFALTWNGVRLGDRVRVACALDPRAYVRLRTADALRTLRTFGRHHAQGVVNAYAARLAALQVEGEIEAPGARESAADAA